MFGKRTGQPGASAPAPEFQPRPALAPSPEGAPQPQQGVQSQPFVYVAEDPAVAPQAGFAQAAPVQADAGPADRLDALAARPRPAAAAPAPASGPGPKATAGFE